jgi:hypothetical protein
MFKNSKKGKVNSKKKKKKKQQQQMEFQSEDNVNWGRLSFDIQDFFLIRRLRMNDMSNYCGS